MPVSVSSPGHVSKRRYAGKFEAVLSKYIDLNEVSLKSKMPLRSSQRGEVMTSTYWTFLASLAWLLFLIGVFLYVLFA